VVLKLGHFGKKKYLENFEMWCGKRDILHTIKKRKVNWIGHIWRRNCFIKHVIDGKIEEKTRKKK
jgi:hypothetical protein